MPPPRISTPNIGYPSATRPKIVTGVWIAGMFFRILYFPCSRERIKRWHPPVPHQLLFVRYTTAIAGAALAGGMSLYAKSELDFTSTNPLEIT